MCGGAKGLVMWFKAEAERQLSVLRREHERSKERSVFVDGVGPNAIKLLHKPPCYRSKAVTKMVHHSMFNGVVMLVICLNTVLLASEHFEMSPDWVEVHNYAGYAFNGIFMLELLLKLVGLGHKNYFAEPFNVLDFSLVREFWGCFLCAVYTAWT